jgi:hypothetical protein
MQFSLNSTTKTNFEEPDPIDIVSTEELNNNNEEATGATPTTVMSPASTSTLPLSSSFSKTRHSNRRRSWRLFVPHVSSDQNGHPW